MLVSIDIPVLTDYAYPKLRSLANSRQPAAFMNIFNFPHFISHYFSLSLLACLIYTFFEYATGINRLARKSDDKLHYEILRYEAKIAEQLRVQTGGGSFY
jgi:hypothetical protein